MKAIKLVNDHKLMGHLIYLFERWIDEQEYEDWSEYQKSAKKAVDPHVDTFISFSHSPRALTFMLDGDKYKITFKFSASSVSTELQKLN